MGGYDVWIHKLMIDMMDGWMDRYDGYDGWVDTMDG